MYNVSMLQNQTGFYNLAVAANVGVGGFLFTMFVILVFVILLMNLKRYPIENGLLVSSFICFLLSAVFAYIGLVRLYLPLGFIVLLAIMLFYTSVRQD